jgi:Zn finger protein HypA/HybF involved in hydrogenase expression
MFAEISAAIQSTKALSDLLKAAKTLSNYNEVTAAVAEVNLRLMDATAVALASQETQTRLTARITELENELAKIQDWEKEASRYDLKEIDKGAFVYTLKPGATNGEPDHWLCTNCFAKKEKSILQLDNVSVAGHHYLCPNCKAEIWTRRR